MFKLITPVWLLARSKSSTHRGAPSLWARIGARTIKRFLILFTLVSVYSAVILLVYVTRVRGFEYLGYTFKEPNWFYLCFSVLTLTVAAMALPKRIDRLSGFVLWMLFALVVVPSGQVSLYTLYLSPEAGLVAGTAITLSFAVAIAITQRRKAPSQSWLSLSPRLFWLLITGFSIVVYTIVAVTFGLQLRFISVLDVYEIREGYEAQLASASGLVSYLLGTQSNVVNPLIIIKGIVSRNFSVVILGMLAQALLFSATGFKTILFSIPAVLLVSLIFLMRQHALPAQFDGTPRASLFLWAPAAMISMCVAIDAMTSSIVWTSLFARRFVITPGLMTGIYVDHYSQNPLAFLAHSVLSSWIQTSYEMPPAKVIGLWVTGSTETSMNAHLFADGFANFGWLGMLGAGVVLGIYLRVADRAASGLPAAVQALALLMLAITLSNTSILTSMFTHGLVAAVILMALAPRTGWSYVPSEREWREQGAAKLETAKVWLSRSRDRDAPDESH